MFKVLPLHHFYELSHVLVNANVINISIESLAGVGTGGESGKVLVTLCTRWRAPVLQQRVALIIIQISLPLVWCFSLS